MASSSHAINAAEQGYEEDEEEDVIVERVASAISVLVELVLSEREAYVKRRVSANKEQLDGYTRNFVRLDEERKRSWGNQDTSSFVSLCLKSRHTYGALYRSGESNSGERLAALDSNGVDKPVSVIFGFQTGGKTTVRSVKLPKIENVPPYTTWIYLDRNQRMTEDQSVVGRRRIYYDKLDNETRLASESEDDDTGDDDDKDEHTHDFSRGEDSLIRMSVRELGKKAVVFLELSEVLDISTEEIKARYDILSELNKNEESELSSEGGTSSHSRRMIESSTFENASRALVPCSAGKETVNEEEAATPANGDKSDTQPEDEKNEPKDLLTAMDSFDNLFCRRCLVFDCRLHGCSQAIVHPSERQQPWNGTEEAMSTPCNKDCYLHTDSSYILRTRLRLDATPQPEGGEPSEQDPLNTQEGDVGGSERMSKRSRTSSRERSCSSETQVPAPSAIAAAAAAVQRSDQPKIIAKEKKLEKRVSGTRRSLSRRVKQNYPRRESTTLLLSQVESTISIDSDDQDFPKDESPTLKEEESSLKLKEVMDPDNDDVGEDDTSREGETADEKLAILPVPEILGYKEGQDGVPGDIPIADVGVGWSEMEKGLYEKGLQMFGRNSCLIARNLLQGCKTCAEVAKYTLELDAAGLGGVRRIADSLDIEAASRERLYGGRRKKGARKLKYTSRSILHPLLRKRMSNGKDQTCRQYTPCNCLFTCGKQCPCLLNGTCCEKYCGCSKSCKNRFRGCHCAKSNCCSRQCPCFAAMRECDPDVCRNCWVGCGDSTSDGPPPRGDNYACHNMKLMLKQQQRVLLGRSAVAGWGAFLKNPVAKHEYLGEYTGELISHREADKRGKIYDRENSSFLFNLNDQYVLDACRKGDKLKFANHSLQPNCYAKVVMVSGDHRVGIFAKERITAGEELFYDYQYEPDRAPVWARRPDDPNRKRDDPPSTTRRAQKAA